MDLGDMIVGFAPADEPSHQELLTRLYAQMEKSFPAGLCADKNDHDAHPVLDGSLAPFWCTADQSQREPWRSEQRRKESI